MSDGGAVQIWWDLTFSGLSTDEWNAIEQLFEAVQGGLNTFTFLDPAGNLLSWSEDYSQAVWTVDPLLVLGPGNLGPFSGTNGTRVTNTAQANQRLLQHISGPGCYQYCFSAYLRSDTQQTVSLMLSSSRAQTERTCTVMPQWTRFILRANLQTSDDGIAFGISLGPGMSVDLFGLQVEPQPGAGRYKNTVDRSGVYANCRFSDDSLTLSTQGVDQHSATIRLVSNLAAT
jgi:hypothetical protein